MYSTKRARLRKKEPDCTPHKQSFGQCFGLRTFRTTDHDHDQSNAHSENIADIGSGTLVITANQPINQPIRSKIHQTGATQAKQHGRHVYKKDRRRRGRPSRWSYYRYFIIIIIHDNITSYVYK